MKRRNFLYRGLPAFGAITASSATMNAATTTDSPKNLQNVFNVFDYGAVGDGKSDDTAAIQETLDLAGKTNGTVLFPGGTFLTGELQIPAFVKLEGNAKWSYSKSSDQSALFLTDTEAKSLLNVTKAFGTEIRGLQLSGEKLEKSSKAHGIMVDNDNATDDYALVIDSCRIEHFPGDGLLLNWIWCYTVKNSHIFQNGRCGLRYRGWDAFIQNNWFSDNREAGFGAYQENAAVTFCNNRVEWNHQGGLIIHGGDGYVVNGNFFDNNGRSSLHVVPREGSWHHTYNFTGNTFRRGASQNWGANPNDADIVLDGAKGLVFSSNVLVSGLGADNPDEKTKYSPKTALKIKNLDDSVITNNTMYLGATEQLVLDEGGHGTGFIMKDNPGSLRGF